MHQRGAMSQQSLHGSFQIRDLQRKPDLTADATSGFKLIDYLRLPLIEELERGSAHLEDQRPAAVVVPEGGRLDAQPAH